MSYTEVFTDFICELLGDIALKFSAVYNGGYEYQKV